MKNIKFAAAMFLVFGMIMIAGEVFFNSTIFLPWDTVNFAVAFGLIMLGAALGAVWKELSVLHRKIEEYKSKPGSRE